MIMAGLNEVLLLGDMCGDLDLRRTRDGTACSNFRLAVPESYKTEDGEKETTTFVTVDVWGKTAETVAKFAGRGSPVLVSGSLRYDSWKDTRTGEKRGCLKIRAKFVKILGRRPAEGQPVEDPEGALRSPVDEQGIPF
jgi:single-strand DNA-binding protein